LAHAGISGRNIGTPSGYLDNTAIVQQSFVDVTAKVAGVKLGVRYGRQTYADGPNLLLVPRDNNTIFLSYNGFRVWAKARHMRIDAFDFTPTRPAQQGTGDDLNKDTRRFSGISGACAFPMTGWADQSSISILSIGACAIRRRFGARQRPMKCASFTASTCGAMPGRSIWTGR
jgi:hypothetical protein